MLPTRGVPGGWRDVWDDPDEAATARVRIDEARRRLAADAVREGALWRAALAAERRVQLCDARHRNRTTCTPEKGAARASGWHKNEACLP